MLQTLLLAFNSSVYGFDSRSPFLYLRHRDGQKQTKQLPIQTVGGFNSRLPHSAIHNFNAEVMRKLNGRDAQVAQELRILVPGKGKCPICAARHSPDKPHNPQSLYYQIHFWQKNGRFPTDEDARAHCTCPAEE